MRKKSIWIKVIDLMLPPRCPVSGAIVDNPGTLSPAAWQALKFITPPFCAGCGVPFPFATGGDSRCVDCLGNPPPFAAARAAVVYDEASRGMILKFKHGDAMQAIPALTGMMERAGQDILSKADVIVPVPLHRWRLLGRRYNQAALLAQAMGRKLQKPCVPDALLRTRSTPSQGRMKARERAANVRKAFTVNASCRHHLEGRTVLLIDDVLTTGATVRECSHVLLKAGARDVYVLAVARACKE